MEWNALNRQGINTLLQLSDCFLNRAINLSETRLYLSGSLQDRWLHCFIQRRLSSGDQKSTVHLSRGFAFHAIIFHWKKGRQELGANRTICQGVRSSAADMG